MKRILFIVLAIVIAVTCFAVPAFAAPVAPADIDSFNIADFSTTRLIQGDMYWYKMDMDRFDRIVRLQYNSSYPVGEYTSRSQLTVKIPNANDTDTYGFNTIAFGYGTGTDLQYRCIDLSYLPSDFSVRLGNGFTEIFDTVGGGFETPQVQLALHFYDMYGTSLGVQTANMTLAANDWILYNPDVPNTAVYMYISYFVTPITFLSSGEKELLIKAPNLQIGVPYEWYSESVLDNIDQGIGGIGGQLGEIIGGGVNPVIPEGTGDFNTDVDSVIDSAQGGIDYAGGLLDSLGGSLQAAATGFAALTAVFNLFAVMPFFSLLLQLSVTIGLFGLMTGLLGSIVSKFSVRGKGD